MIEQNIHPTVAEKFPYFNTEEQYILSTLITSQDKNTPAFLEAKECFIDLLKKDLDTYHKWDILPDARIHLRRRFLNVSGLFMVVSIEELRRISHEARLKQKKIVFESAPNPLDPNISIVEMHSYDLKYISVFDNFYSKIMLEPNLSAMDFLSGNRLKRTYPASQCTIFRKKLQDEIQSTDYLTASAEPLTNTQMISLYNPDGSLRDLITIGFDMVFESAFVDFFHHAPKLSVASLKRNSYVMSKHFILAALDLCQKVLSAKKDLPTEFPVFFDMTSPALPRQINQLVIFVHDKLLGQVQEKIQQYNKELGLDPNYQLIYWESDKIPSPGDAAGEDDE